MIARPSEAGWRKLLARKEGYEHAPLLPLLFILAIAIGLRTWKLGSLSFWYDEVVTMRLAETAGPAALFHRLSEIDATRAPLHPLCLQFWIKLFGATEASSRSLSVLFGVVTVALVFWIGRSAFDDATGLWAAGLSALSPPLVYYSRETRMYAMLVMLSCVCWGLLFTMPSAKGRGIALRLGGYGIGLASLVCCHPLGLLMAMALLPGSLLMARSWPGGLRRWLMVHALALAATLPWIGRYFDHSPEFLSGRLPIKFLLGTPIGFLGGNGLVLLAMVAIVLFGLNRRSNSTAPFKWTSAAGLCIWLVVPPLLLYGYSWIASPVFGPARYTLFVAPAYLLLLAQGIVQLPIAARCLILPLVLGLAGQSLSTTVYAPGLKADWRAFASSIPNFTSEQPSIPITILVRRTGDDSSRNVEVETARYYLPASCQILSEDDPSAAQLVRGVRGQILLAVGFKERETAPLERLDGGWSLWSRFLGLAVYRPEGP